MSNKSFSIDDPELSLANSQLLQASVVLDTPEEEDKKFLDSSAESEGSSELNFKTPKHNKISFQVLRVTIKVPFFNLQIPPLKKYLSYSTFTPWHSRYTYFYIAKLNLTHSFLPGAQCICVKVQYIITRILFKLAS